MRIGSTGELGYRSGRVKGGRRNSTLKRFIIYSRRNMLLCRWKENICELWYRVTELLLLWKNSQEN
jgi:hypothetical protein